MQNLINSIRHNRFHKGEEDSSFLKLFVAKQLVQGAAVALLSIFLPIFLYEVSGNNFEVVGSYYAAISLMYILLLAPGMRAVNRFGFSIALAVGALYCVVMNFFLLFLTAENLPWMLPLIMFSMVGYWVFHWVPFQVDFVLFSKKESRGRQVSLAFATRSFLGVAGPLLAGFIVAVSGYKVLFLTTMVLMLVASASYLYVPEPRTKYTWTVKKTWRELFNPKHRRVLSAEFAVGAEAIVQVIVWPIFLYELLQGDVLEVGAVSTVIVAATIIIQLFLGSYLDKHAGSAIKTLKFSSGLNALGWVFKIFVLSAFQVFFVGLFHNIVRMMARTPYTSIIFDTSAEQGRYLDEFTVLREMAQHLGRALSLVLISFMAVFISIEWTFLIAAVAAIAYNLVYMAQTQGK